MKPFQIGFELNLCCTNTGFSVEFDVFKQKFVSLYNFYIFISIESVEIKKGCVDAKNKYLDFISFILFIWLFMGLSILGLINIRCCLQ